MKYIKMLLLLLWSWAISLIVFGAYHALPAHWYTILSTKEFCVLVGSTAIFLIVQIGRSE
jgi:hypothetical protein